MLRRRRRTVAAGGHRPDDRGDAVGRRLDWVAAIADVPSLHAPCFRPVGHPGQVNVVAGYGGQVGGPRERAADAAAEVIVDYEPLPAMVDSTKALAADATLVHPEKGDNIAF